MSIKETLKKIKRVAKYYFNEFRGIKVTAVPENELELFKSIKDELDVVFDVGARTDLSYYFIKPSCEFHLFEPSKKFFEKLSWGVSLIGKNAKQPVKIYLNNFGLSDIHKDDCVYYDDIQAFVPNPILGSMDFGHRYSLRKLDDYVLERGIDKIDFLKIDTEGLDYKVMLGGIDTIKNKVKYLQFELWTGEGVKRFVDLLPDFDLYLMMEPRLQAIVMRLSNNNPVFNKRFIKLDTHLINFLDKMIIPTGAGGNIIGLHKTRTTNKIINNL